MIIFTRHALQRIRERNIAKSQIVSALARPDSATSENGNIALLKKRHGKKTLGVVAEVFKQKFIIGSEGEMRVYFHFARANQLYACHAS